MTTNQRQLSLHPAGVVKSNTRFVGVKARISPLLGGTGR